MAKNKSDKLRNIFIDPYEGGLRGRWYLVLAAVVWVTGQFIIYRLMH